MIPEMTGVSFVVVTLALAGVFAMFWWLVEVTGGVAGQALSVCRSMQTGVVSWRESRGEPPLALLATTWTGTTSVASGTDVLTSSFSEGFEVPIQRVRGPRSRNG